MIGYLYTLRLILHVIMVTHILDLVQYYAVFHSQPQTLMDTGLQSIIHASKVKF